LDRLTADLVRHGNAVIVVHGIDYNENDVYDLGALGVSDLDKTLPGEATAPALCGPLRRSSQSQSPTATRSANAENQNRSPTTTYVASLVPEPASLVPPTPPASGLGGAAISWSRQGLARSSFVCHPVQSLVSTGPRQPGAAVG
jgi:hypothetical protein